MDRAIIGNPLCQYEPTESHVKLTVLLALYQT